MSDHNVEIRKGERFKFGENWNRFLTLLNEQRINEAVKSLQSRLETTSLDGRSFLDIGSGSGLFSLAARRLGATVHSFDYDPQSVACTQELKNRYYRNDDKWIVERGSILDENYLHKLDQFDIVYSWGVLHHSGRMWEALANVSSLPIKGNGKLFIAIYNDQGWVTSYWKLIKKLYNKYKISRWLLILLHWPYLYGLRYLVRFLTKRLPLERGMSMWWDMIDWLGGYPFEVAKPEDIFYFFKKNHYQLTQLKTNGGRNGCNEYVFRRNN